jgi:hypothetical protein
VIATDFKSRYKKSLKMPKGFSEAVTQRWKNNAMNKREKNKRIYFCNSTEANKHNGGCVL